MAHFQANFSIIWTSTMSQNSSENHDLKSQPERLVRKVEYPDAQHSFLLL